MLRSRTLNLSCNVLRGLKGMAQFASLQSLNLAMNRVADPRQLLHLPPSLVCLHIQGNPCCSCTCHYMAILAACPAIKSINSTPVPHWHLSAAASAVELQVSLPQTIAGVSLLYRAVTAAAKQAAVNVEFVKLFGQQHYGYSHLQQEQQQQHGAILPGLSAARVIFSALITAAQSLHGADDRERVSSSSSISSSRCFVAVAALSSLPALAALLLSGRRLKLFPCVHLQPAKLNRLAHTRHLCAAARVLVPSITLEAVDMEAVVASRAGRRVAGVGRGGRCISLHLCSCCKAGGRWLLLQREPRTLRHRRRLHVHHPVDTMRSLLPVSPRKQRLAFGHAGAFCALLPPPPPPFAVLGAICARQPRLSQAAGGAVVVGEERRAQASGNRRYDDDWLVAFAFGSSHVMRLTFMCLFTRHTSHVTRHTSHVTRHTSHVTRHTSHVTSALLPSIAKSRATARQRMHLACNSSSSSSCSIVPTEQLGDARGSTPLFPAALAVVGLTEQSQHSACGCRNQRASGACADVNVETAEAAASHARPSVTELLVPSPKALALAKTATASSQTALQTAGMLSPSPPASAALSSNPSSSRSSPLSPSSSSSSAAAAAAMLRLSPPPRRALVAIYTPPQDSCPTQDDSLITCHGQTAASGRHASAGVMKIEKEPYHVASPSPSSPSAAAVAAAAEAATAAAAAEAKRKASKALKLIHKSLSARSALRLRWWWW
jgi:hypothetical protein